jgi:hypothetical protein
MVNSPISIPLGTSASRNPSDLAKTQAIAADALRIERYINSQMDKEFIREFDFAALAVELSLDVNRVGALLGNLAGRENAITVCNPQRRPRTPAPGRATSRASSHSGAGTPAGIEPSGIASPATT